MTIQPRRLLHQVSLNLHLRWKAYAMILVVSLLILVFQYFNKDFALLDFISARFSSNTFFTNRVDPEIHKFHFKWFPTFFIILSSIITSMIFSEYGEKRSRTFHLSLPATSTEKWLSKVLICLVISPLLLILLYQIFIWVSQFWPDVDKYYQVSVNVLDPYFRSQIINSILLQGLVVLGAVWFKKFSIVKTLLFGLLTVALYNLSVVISLILFADNNELAENVSIQTLSSVSDLIIKSDLRTTLSKMSFTETFMDNTLSIGIVSLICLGISFIKFKETQA